MPSPGRGKEEPYLPFLSFSVLCVISYITRKNLKLSERILISETVFFLAVFQLTSSWLGKKTLSRSLRLVMTFPTLPTIDANTSTAMSRSAIINKYSSSLFGRGVSPTVVKIWAENQKQ